MKDLSNNKYLKASGLKQEDAVYGSQKEMIEALSDPKYGKDAAFTDLAQYMIWNTERAAASNQDGPISGRALNRAMADPAGARRIQDMEIFAEQREKMFGDPRYQTSPSSATMKGV